MPIARLSLSHFRNHRMLDLALDALGGGGFVVLSGANGAGKTNIAEALSLLSPGRGLRGSPFVQMATAGSGQGFAIAAQLAGADGGSDVRLGTGIAADQPAKRLVRVNGAAASASSLAEWLAVVWLTPAMDRIFMESAGARRRFLDRLVLAVNPAHATHSTRYEAAMRARTKLLIGDAPADPAWLAALEAQMAAHGAALDEARHALVAALAQRLTGDSEDFLARPDVALAYDDGAATPWEPPALAAALREARGRDAAAGRALIGPHRIDLDVHHAQKAIPASLGSTGEQKAMLIRIILAHAALLSAGGARPLLLILDEVAAHLDPDRRAALYARLAQSGAQCWMTGTDADLFAGLPGASAHFHLDGGALRRIA